ncbi:MAG: hypothetical protein E7076_00965 [Bacteroidales bacterium]|nr:hypothetical protein [Bacteroidales bacterium]
MKKVLLALQLLFSLSAYTQDWVVYFDENEYETTKQSAKIKVEVFSNGDGSYVEKIQFANGEKVKNKITLLNDTIYQMNMANGNVARVIYHKQQDGMYLLEMFEDGYFATGKSRYLFPVVKEGIWDFYDLNIYEKVRSYEYQSNRLERILLKELPADIVIGNSDSIKIQYDQLPMRNDEMFMYGLMFYIPRNIRYPAKMLEQSKSGVVYVQIIIKASSEVEINIKRSVTPEFDNEALRVITNYFKDAEIIPAKFNDKYIDTDFIVPVRFRLIENHSTNSQSESKSKESDLNIRNANTWNQYPQPGKSAIRKWGGIDY